MKKKSLSAKKTIHKSLLKYLKNKKINKVFGEFYDHLEMNTTGNIAVAISGGPDSLALSFLSKCYSLKKRIKAKFFIVDHKLRKNSLHEAKSVKSLLKKFNIDCKILKWHGKKPNSNIQGIARNYRYDLLINECKKNKIKNLLLGHHIDDLYENFFIRLLRGSGLKGLASFGETIPKEIKKISILRPLIKFEKKELIFIAKNVFRFYIKDPSNQNFFFKRVRIRRLISELEKEGFDKKKLALTLKNLQSANNSLNFYVKKNIQDNAKFLKKKNIYILNKLFFYQPQEVVFRSISSILNKVSGRYYSARGKSIFDLILKINLNKISKFTLGGCYIEKMNETIIITKEK